MPHAAPTADVIPAMRYRDAPAAIKFLQDAFGLEPLNVYAGEAGIIHHAELTWGTGCVMLGSHVEGDDGKLPMPLGGSTLYLIVDDVDAHHARAVAAGAEIIREPRDEDFGGRGYVARDPEGNTWSFGSYRPRHDQTQ